MIDKVKFAYEINSLARKKGISKTKYIQDVIGVHYKTYLAVPHAWTFDEVSNTTYSKFRKVLDLNKIECD